MASADPYLRHRVELQQAVFQARPEPTTLYALVHLEPQAVSGRMPLDIRLVLDRSYSMSELAGSGTETKLELLKGAVSQLVSDLLPGDRLTVVVFHDKHQVLIPPTVLHDQPQRQELLKKIAAIGLGGGTRMSPALKAACEVAPMPDYLTRLICFTDGNLCCTNADTDRKRALELALTSRKQLPWLVFATGTDYDDTFLSNLAELNSGRYDHVSDVSDATALFAQEINVMGEVALTQAMLSIETLNGFELRQVNRVVPEVRPVSFQSLSYCAIELGELDRVRGQKVLIQLEGVMNQACSVPVAKIGVSFNLPLKKLLNLSEYFEITAAFSTDPGLQQLQAEVLTTVQLTGASQLTAQGIAALQQGQADLAGRTLTTAAELYTRLGDAQMGQQLRTLCSAASTGTGLQQEETRRTLTTQLKYTVQRTLMPKALTQLPQAQPGQTQPETGGSI
ncbi:MAG: VWA domain-containing protein [Candidatus Sericytochromatia bacterium]